MTFILGNYFHCRSFNIDFIFSIITLLKLSELWESSDRCFNAFFFFFTFMVPEVRFCALRASWNSAVWHITWGIELDNLEVMEYTHFWLLQGIYILTVQAKTTTKKQESPRQWECDCYCGCLGVNVKVWPKADCIFVRERMTRRGRKLHCDPCHSCQGFSVKIKFVYRI